MMALLLLRGYCGMECDTPSRQRQLNHNHAALHNRLAKMKLPCVVPYQTLLRLPRLAGRQRCISHAGLITSDAQTVGRCFDNPRLGGRDSAAVLCPRAAGADAGAVAIAADGDVDRRSHAGARRHGLQDFKVQTEKSAISITRSACGAASLSKCTYKSLSGSAPALHLDCSLDASPHVKRDLLKPIVPRRQGLHAILNRRTLCTSSCRNCWKTSSSRGCPSSMAVYACAQED